MNDDIVPELLKKIQEDFGLGVEKSQLVKTALKAIADKKATFKNANQYAIEIGQILSKVLNKHITVDTLPDGQLYFNIFDRILNDTLKNNHKIISDYATSVEKILNKKSNLNVSVKAPKVNQDRIDGLVNKILEYETFDEAKWLLGDSIVNFSQSVADDVIKANVDFHAKIGLSPKIRRSVIGNCCEWCSKKAGTYNYPVPQDIYFRHRNCDCLVEYFPGDGRIQNSHTKKWR